MFVSAYLVSLGFAESHAGEISEEVVSKYDDACVPRARVLSEDQLFQFDTLDCNEEEKMPSEDSESEEEQETRRGPSEEERRALDASIAASQPGLAVVARRVSRERARQAEPGEQRALDVPGIRRGVATVPGGPEDHPAQERLERLRPLSAPRRRKPRRGGRNGALDAGARAPRRRRRRVRPDVSAFGEAPVRPTHGRGEPRTDAV
jgi:hypothetical protein